MRGEELQVVTGGDGSAAVAILEGLAAESSPTELPETRATAPSLAGYQSDTFHLHLSQCYF